ncbi:MAG: glycerophosphodiester phosphodiesterase family protein [Acholeplasmataceae bacterium]
MKLIAHRGSAKLAPENSIKAFELAAKEPKFAGIECDIYTTKDGEFVVFHDLSLNRMVGRKKQIMDLTYEEISAFTLKSGKNISKFPDLKIPKLSEFLDICHKASKIAVIEVKAVHNITQLIDLVNLIDQYENLQAIIISFNIDYLKFIRAISSIELQYLIEKVTNEVIYEARVNELDLSLKAKIADEKAIKKLRKSNFKLGVWTVNRQDELNKFAKLGIDYLTTEK